MWKDCLGHSILGRWEEGRAMMLAQTASNMSSLLSCSLPSLRILLVCVLDSLPTLWDGLPALGILSLRISDADSSFFLRVESTCFEPEVLGQL